MLLPIKALITLVISTVYALAGFGGVETPAFPHPAVSCYSGTAGSIDCDPVNLVFPGKTWEEVRDALRDSGWTTAGLGSHHLADMGAAGRMQEDEQLFLVDSFHSRFHIRLWQGPGPVTFGSVHHEVGDLERLTHRIDMDWELAEAFVSDGLCASARSCRPSAVDGEQHAFQKGGTDWRGWHNDARLTVIVLR